MWQFHDTVSQWMSHRSVKIMGMQYILKSLFILIKYANVRCLCCIMSPFFRHFHMARTNEANISHLAMRKVYQQSICNSPLRIIRIVHSRIMNIVEENWSVVNLRGGKMTVNPNSSIYLTLQAKSKSSLWSPYSITCFLIFDVSVQVTKSSMFLVTRKAGSVITSGPTRM